MKSLERTHKLSVCKIYVGSRRNETDFRYADFNCQRVAVRKVGAEKIDVFELPLYRPRYIETGAVECAERRIESRVVFRICTVCFIRPRRHECVRLFDIAVDDDVIFCKLDACAS